MAKKQKQVVGELIFGIHPLVELLQAKRRKLISIYTTKPQPKGWRDIEKMMQCNAGNPKQCQNLAKSNLCHLLIVFVVFLRVYYGFVRKPCSPSNTPMAPGAAPSLCWVPWLAVLRNGPGRQKSDKSMGLRESGRSASIEPSKQVFGKMVLSEGRGTRSLQLPTFGRRSKMFSSL